MKKLNILYYNTHTQMFIIKYFVCVCVCVCVFVCEYTKLVCTIHNSYTCKMS